MADRLSAHCAPACDTSSLEYITFLVHTLLATHASPLTAYVRLLREAVLLGGLLIFLYRSWSCRWLEY